MKRLAIKYHFEWKELRKQSLLTYLLIFPFVSCFSGFNVDNQKAIQWCCWEHSLLAHDSNTNQAATLNVIFTGPKGRTFTIPAFTDDGKTYHFRAAFPIAGVWEWRTICENPNAGLHNRKGKILVKKYEGNNPLYKHGDLRVSDDKRYLVHSDGTPFLWMGDTGWIVELKSTMDEWRYYVDTRASQKFSVIQITPTGFIKKSPDTTKGATSFTEDGRPDSVFWQNLEEKVSYANEKGLVVLFVGVGGKLNDLFSKNPNNQNFASYIAARFAGHTVIFSPSFDQKFDEGNQNVAQELKGLTQHLVTQHPGTNYPTILKYRNDSSLNFCGLQSGHHDGKLPEAYKAARVWTLDLWNGVPIKPVINIEAMYDGYGDNSGPNWREKDARKLGWISWLSGSRGYTYGAGDIRPKVPNGNGGIWTFNTNSTTFDYWRKAILWASAHQMTMMGDFFQSINWWNLVPAQELILNQAEDEMSKMVISKSKKGDLILAYLPDNPIIILNLEDKSKVMKGKWFNPVTGNFVSVEKPIVPYSRVSFTRPVGWEDALLIIFTDKNKVKFLVKNNY